MVLLGQASPPPEEIQGKDVTLAVDRRTIHSKLQTVSIMIDKAAYDLKREKVLHKKYATIFLGDHFYPRTTKKSAPGAGMVYHCQTKKKRRRCKPLGLVWLTTELLEVYYFMILFSCNDANFFWSKHCPNM